MQQDKVFGGSTDGYIKDREENRSKCLASGMGKEVEVCIRL